MRFVMECVFCGSRRESPEGRDPAELEELLDVVDELELVCRECEGGVTVRVAEEGV